MRLGVIASRSKKKPPQYEDFTLVAGYQAVDAGQGGKISMWSYSHGYGRGSYGSLSPLLYRNVIVARLNSYYYITSGQQSAWSTEFSLGEAVANPFSRIEVFYQGNLLATLYAANASPAGPYSWMWARSIFSSGQTYTVRIWY